MTVSTVVLKYKGAQGIYSKFYDMTITFIKNWKTIVPLVTLVFSFFVFSQPQEAKAFDNSRVIDDSRFSDNGTMSEEQIQTFLSSKGSYLTTYTVPAERDVVWQGVTYHESPWIGPAGQEFNATGWSAAHVIYQVSQWYGINPQVLLATLQKESSLVTNSSPAYYGLVQWSMGYAYTEGGIRNVCNTGTNHNPTGSCAGFAMQMDWGGGGLKSWMNLANSRSSGAYQYWTGNTISIDGQWIYLSNGATAALYRYTPHIQTSFYGIFTRWFGSTIWEGPYVVADVSAEEPRGYYLVDNGKKRYLSYEVYVNWGLNNFPVDLINSDTFNYYPEEVALSNYVQDEQGRIFVIDQGQKKWVPDWAPFDLWGFDRGSIVFVSSITLNYIQQGLNFSYLVKAPDSGEIYLIDNQTKRHIISEELLMHLGVPTRNICIVSTGLLDGLAGGSDFSNFIIKGGGVDEFVLDNGIKRHITSRSLFDEWNFNIEEINLVSDEMLTAFPSGIALTSLVKRPNQEGVYYIENGLKKGILNIETFNNWGLSQSEIFTMASTPAFNTFSAGSALTRLPQSEVDGKIYWVENGKKSWVVGTASFNLAGLNWNEVSTTSENLLNSLTEGDDITSPNLITEGTYVFYIDGGVKRFIVDPETFNNWGFNWGNVVFYPSANVRAVPSGEILTRFVKNGTNIYLVQNNGVRWIDSTDTFNFYNFDWNKVVSISDALFNSKNRLSDLVLPQLVAHSNGGTVYFIESHKKRPIESINTFNNWGFSLNNVIFTNNNIFLDNYVNGELLTRFAKDKITGKIYFIENNTKRWITSPDSFNSNSWDWNEVKEVEPATLEMLQDGSNI